MSRWTAWILFILALAPFAATRHYSHVHDDHDFRGPNSLVADARADLPLLWTADIFGTYEEPTGQSGFWRPLILTSFRFEHWITNGRTVPFVWLGHVVTLLLHGLATIALWRLLAALGASGLAATLPAALFAVHPVHAEPVAWLSGRTDVMPTALAFGGLALLLRHRDGPRLALAFVMFLGALLCKETAALLVGLAIPLARLEGRRWRSAAVIPLAALAVAGGLRWWLFDGGIDPGAYTGPESTAVRWLTWLSIVPELLRLLVWPGEATPIHPVAAVTAIGPLVLAGAGALAVIAGALWQSWRAGQSRAFLAWALIGGTLAVLAPWVRFPLGYTEIAAPLYERHLYAAAAAPAILLVTLAARRIDAHPRAALAFSLAGILLLMPVTARRTEVWSSDETFARAALERLPRSPDFLNHLGVALLERAPRDPVAAAEALESFDRAVALTPDALLPRLNRFILLAMLERSDEADVAAAELLKRHATSAPMLDNVARWYLRQGRWKAAAELLERELATGNALPGAPETLAFAQQQLRSPDGR